MEYDLFYKVSTLGILICCYCKYEVWPIKVKQHLKKKHGIKHSITTQVAQAIS